MRLVNLRESIATSLRLARGAAPAAALASGLLSPAAWGAAGDLDPSFADVGRAYALLNLDGAAWSIEPQSDDWILGGGDFYEAGWYNYESYISGFAQRLAGDGSIDSTFAPLGVADTEVLDVVVASDGSMIGVGRTLQKTPAPERQLLTVFRIGPDGARDTAFGVDGVVQLFPGVDRSVASSVILESDGRVVVAGVRDGKLVVLRLLANGTLDAGFGDGGVFTGPDNVAYLLPRIVRIAGGGYRITIQSDRCQVLALTAGGAIDASFGASGLASLDPSSSCRDMAVLDDGRLVVAGRQGADEGFAVRLLASGEPDATFQASAVAGAMREATALEVSDGGSIILAGQEAAGAGPTAVVMRLEPDGELDAAFGTDGYTLIDLPSAFGTFPTIHDIAVTDGRVLVAGGDGVWRQRPFVARLLGGADPGGPGVVGVASRYLAVRPQDGQAVVTVRRMGGRTGRASVVVTTPAEQYLSATPGEDYTAVERTLTWEDGDATDRQVVVPLLPDLSGAVAEEYEGFEVALTDVQGGLGLGTRISQVTILPDGDPAGQFAIGSLADTRVGEGSGFARIVVSRMYYATGAVSVTVTPVAGSAAAGSDFDASPVTLTWASGDTAGKEARFRIINDDAREDDETFTVQLSAPTGGAVIGPRSSVPFVISRNDQPPPPPPPSSSGGGAVGLLSLLLLCGAEWARRVAGTRRGRRPEGSAARPAPQEGCELPVRGPSRLPGSA